MYTLNKEVWDRLYDMGWYPFIGIGGDRLKGLISRITEGRPTERAEQELIECFDEKIILGYMGKFRKYAFLTAHFPFLETGINRYLEGDYMSSINNIWPRIEGIWRYAFAGGRGHVSQTILLDNMRDVVANQYISPSVYFPDRFRDYLLRYYFKSFDLSSGVLDVSRHSIGHGVADAATYNKKNALVGILIVDQLTYYLRLRHIATP
jgi:hypothetical protein